MSLLCEVSDESQPKNTSSQDPVIQKLLDSSNIFQTSAEFKWDRTSLRSDFIINDKANSHFQAGLEAMGQFQLERAVTCFTKARTLQPEQSHIYVARAEAYLQLCDFKSAALDYKLACYLQPQNMTHVNRLAFIYYLLGQFCFDRGMFLEALNAFAKAAELKPDFRPYYTRSLACLTALGRYSDCIRLVTNWIETDTPSSDLFTLRARLHHQLSHATQCYYDLKAALRLNPSCLEAQKLLEKLKQAAECSEQKAVSRAVEGELSDALSKITTAVEQNPEKSKYYLLRGTLYRRLKHFTAAIEDLVFALEFSDAEAKHPNGDPPEDSENVKEDTHIQLVLTYNDFAVHCFSQGFYSDAITLLTKAIQEERNESRLFINRGDCFTKQKEWLYALADYQQAEDLDPQNSTIWLRLAALHNTLGQHAYAKMTYQEAAKKFSVAIKYNPQEAQYYGNRAKAYSKMLKMEAAMQDAISAHILDPANDELVALLLRLFPDCSLSDVISSGTAQTVKAQMMEQIQSWKAAPRAGSPAPISRLSDKLERMDSRHHTYSQLEAYFGSLSKVEDVEEKPKPCVSSQDLVRTKKQMTHTVKKLMYQRESLCYTGPRLAPLYPPPTVTADSTDRQYSWRSFRGLGLNC